MPPREKMMRKEDKAVIEAAEVTVDDACEYCQYRCDEDGCPNDKPDEATPCAFEEQTRAVHARRAAGEQGDATYFRDEIHHLRDIALNDQLSYPKRIELLDERLLHLVEILEGMEPHPAEAVVREYGEGINASKPALEQIQVTDKWPEAVADNKPARICAICGRVEHFAYAVNDTFWREVVPPSFRPSPVCLPCLDEMALAKGLDIGPSLITVQFTGKNKTIILTPTREYRYDIARKHGLEVK